METHGLNHIHLRVRDLEASLRFYAAFGFVKVAGHDDLSFLVRPGTSDLITLRVGRTHGVDHFGFMLKDASQLDAAIAALEGCGGQLVERLTLEPGSVPSAIVLDPDGYRVQI